MQGSDLAHKPCSTAHQAVCWVHAVHAGCTLSTLCTLRRAARRAPLPVLHRSAALALKGVLSVLRGLPDHAGKGAFFPFFFFFYKSEFLASLLNPLLQTCLVKILPRSRACLLAASPSRLPTHGFPLTVPKKLFCTHVTVCPPVCMP